MVHILQFLSLKKIVGQLCDPKNALLFASWCTQWGRNFHNLWIETNQFHKIFFDIFHFPRGTIIIFVENIFKIICLKLTYLLSQVFFWHRLIKIFWPAVKYVRNQFIIPSPWCCNQIQGHFFKNFFLHYIELSVCLCLSTFLVSIQGEN